MPPGSFSPHIQPFTQPHTCSQTCKPVHEYKPSDARSELMAAQAPNLCKLPAGDTQAYTRVYEDIHTVMHRGPHREQSHTWTWHIHTEDTHQEHMTWWRPGLNTEPPRARSVLQAPRPRFLLLARIIFLTPIPGPWPPPLCPAGSRGPRPQPSRETWAPQLQRHPLKWLSDMWEHRGALSMGARAGVSFLCPRPEWHSD